MGNRLTQYGGAATAFSALSAATADTLFANFQNHPTYFTQRHPTPTTVGQFRDTYSQPLRDFNTAGVVSAHLGRRLSGMAGGYYDVYGTRVQVNRERVQECLDAVDAIVAEL